MGFIPALLPGAAASTVGSKVLGGGGKTPMVGGGLDPSNILGLPTAPPKYEDLRNAKGQLKSQYQFNAEPDLAGSFTQQLRGTGDIERLRERSTAQGLSPQARLQQQALTQGAQEQAQQGLSSAWGRMASRGGLDAGARERLMGQSNRNLQQGLQNIGLQTSIEDERQKMDLAKNLPGMQQARESAILTAQQGDVGRREGAQRTNLGTLLGDIQGKREYQSGLFAEQMKALGAQKQAEAEASKGKK